MSQGSDKQNPRAADAISLGAHYRIAKPAPQGVDELGERLIQTQGGLAAALGALALWLYQLEGRER